MRIWWKIQLRMNYKAFDDEDIVSSIMKNVFTEHPETDGIFASDDMMAACLFAGCKRIEHTCTQPIKGRRI